MNKHMSDAEIKFLEESRTEVTNRYAIYQSQHQKYR